jgi:predicted secreted Zn-dependent protease
VPVIKPAFFGPGVRITWYTIEGDTATELVDSISDRGPYHPWLGERAIAVTRSLTQRRFALVGSGSACHIVPTAMPAIRTTFTIVLPRWKPTRTAEGWTIRWWADELRDVARHEREHIRITRAAVRRANKVLASSDCSDWAVRLDAVYRRARRDNCRFDMDEYGKESGLTLRACVGG